MSRPRDLPEQDQFHHGTRARYVCGCRCDACRASNTAYYHERQRRGRERAAELAVTSHAPVSKGWKRPDGSRGRRTYTRACPGVEGLPCPSGSHLRRDSKGGVCRACRDRLAWNGLVDAGAVKRHLRKLSRQGVGYKAVADAADVAKTTLAQVLAGRKRRIRRDIERRVLRVTAAAVADHALVDARATWRLIDRLLARGFTRAELARRLGAKTPALQLGRDRILATTAMKVERLYRQLKDGRPRRQATRCRCRRPIELVRDGVHWCARCERQLRQQRTRSEAA